MTIMHYYEIAPTKIVRQTSDRYTYASNLRLNQGQIVVIPVGSRQLLGVVIAKVSKPSFATKEIISTGADWQLPEPLVQTALWISQYYASHLATVLSGILPAGLTKNRRTQTKTVLKNIREHQPIKPTPEQQKVIRAILESSSPTQLLHGVTGSGKTLVYIEVAKQHFSKGKSSIILVPEIALTTQLVDEFRNVFNDDVLVMHSMQTEAQRHKVWLECLNTSSPKIVIGPRSALFAPLKHIGLIAIDEFHEPTYKQEQTPRYHATRVATMLASFHQATALLGSATPDISDYYLAQHTKAPIHQLPNRAVEAAQAPKITVVDMKKKDNFLQQRYLSNQLLASIEASLEAGKQSLIFHNRRGTAAITICDNCGWTATDPDSDLPLTLHADKHQLISHISGLTMPVPTSCPQCKSVDILHKGIGTKLLETTLSKLFPNKKVVRFDGDSTSGNQLQDLYQQLYSGEIDIIIGTQVVAKGLDLPKLRTVGIIQADTGLSLPDYSADERTFQLLSQVIGRVGRTKNQSEVIVQSYQPEHLAIKAGLAQDFDSFYQQTVKQRLAHKFPPHSYLLKLTCIYKTETATITNSKKLIAQLKKAYPDVTFMGPAPSFYEKQRGSYRWQIIAKSPKRAQLKAVASMLPAKHWQYELDPVSLL